MPGGATISSPNPRRPNGARDRILRRVQAHHTNDWRGLARSFSRYERTWLSKRCGIGIAEYDDLPEWSLARLIDCLAKLVAE